MCIRDRITTNGDYVWTKTFGGTGWDQACSVVIDTSNNIFIGGRFEGTVDFNFTDETQDNQTSHGNFDAFLTKINPDGGYEWTKTFGGVNDDGISSLALDSSNNIYASGDFSSGTLDFNFTGGTDNHTSNGGSDIFVTKVNYDGTYGLSLIHISEPTRPY